MKLNNKGFAITAILYALLILFSLSLVSVVAGLNSRNKILEKSIETIENKYNWECITEEKDPQLPNYTVTEKRGKYIFKYDNTDQKCISYIEKGEELDPTKLEYTTNACNNITEKNKLKLTEYCPEKSN